ncbi:MAG: DUF975 family protein [Kiritimatiellae bacterium]|nr:DUF975 family protein [Kiritimatiellia bacterium]
MPTARDIRAAAWRLFKEGGLLPVLAGFALVMLLRSLVELAFFRLGVSQGWLEMIPLPQFLGQHGVDFALFENDLGQLGASVIQLGAEIKQLGPELSELAAAVHQLGTQMNQIGGQMVADMHGILSAASVPRINPGYVAGSLVVDTLFEGVVEFGCSVLVISAVRGGATAFQALSGFRFPMLLRTAALGLLSTALVLLGTLLFVVPGFMAYYSYRMAFMLLADNPEWSPWRALQESRKLMYGHRMRLFALDASFTGWFMLLLVTNLAGLFVLPYFATANAAFYEDLLDRSGR